MTAGTAGDIRHGSPRGAGGTIVTYRAMRASGVQAGETMYRLALFLVVLSVGCGGGGGGGRTVQCSKDACTGNYNVNIDQTGGTCTGIASEEEALQQCIQPSTNCTVTSETWSNNDCTVTRARTCFFLGLNMKSDQVWTITQSESGDTLTGTLTTSVSRQSDGSFLCTGSYTVNATRQ